MLVVYHLEFGATLAFTPLALHPGVQDIVLAIAHLLAVGGAAAIGAVRHTQLADCAVQRLVPFGIVLRAAAAAIVVVAHAAGPELHLALGGICAAGGIVDAWNAGTSVFIGHQIFGAGALGGLGQTDRRVNCFAHCIVAAV